MFSSNQRMNPGLIELKPSRPRPSKMGFPGRKRRRLVRVAKENEMRGWEEMNHEILVNIFSRLSKAVALNWWQGILTLCKPWFLAALDVLFPPSQVLDLRPFGRLYYLHRDHFVHYLKLLLDTRSPTTYTQIWFPQSSPFPEQAYYYIARRLPSLQGLYLPIGTVGSDIYVFHTLCYWSNLEQVQLPVWLLSKLATHCKRIHTLRLYGTIKDDDAFLLAKSFPLLKHLEIPDCALSKDALSIILDGHKSLVTLNTRHCFCLDAYGIEIVSAYYNYDIDFGINDLICRGHLPRQHVAQAILEWKEEEILKKVGGIQRHLKCARQNCLKCRDLYIIPHQVEDELYY